MIYTDSANIARSANNQVSEGERGREGYSRGCYLECMKEGESQ